MPVSDAALARYRKLLDRRRLTAGSLLGRAWDQLGSWDELDVARYSRFVTPLLSGVKTSTVAMATAFYGLVLDEPPPPIAASSVTVVADLRQPFTAHWHALSMGRPFSESVAAGRSAVEQVAQGFVESTARRTGDAFTEATGRTVRWDRRPRPDACSFCRRVAGPRYLTAESADFGHVPCKCELVPVPA